MFESKIYDKEKFLLIEVKGDLDIYSEDEFRSFIEKEIEGADKDMVIDIKDLDYLDSTGLGLFMKVYKIGKEKDKTVSIINPKENILKLFKITDLTDVFNME
ncbi:STAS domain-containing protein [Anaerococcus degeneri]|uniref:Anti-sigma factor antagonist n=1 Tax=Anaerococcus degeneri TaxID=361500 RepID=A0ABS7YXD3_9FIRM|nr:STAS domain-containing protein [Anaerococcus degeneri]MBP2015409.1 anti-sigma B factor antagonist [Anaerococcus degeneri]MCA2096303.1 STAS domain-containing protein [Anaerococcus degeneri]